MQALPDTSEVYVMEKRNDKVIIPNPKAFSAFTLVELLVATAALSILVLVLVQIVSQTSQSWLSGEGGVERRRNSRSFTDFIGDELRQALKPIESQTTDSPGNLQFLVNPPASRLPNDCLNVDAIFWQAPLATETSLGDIAVIGYFVRWYQGKPYLCRLFINPSINSNEGLIRNPSYLIYDAEDENSWLSPSLIDSLVRPTDKAAGYRGMFADNVLGLWVRCYGPDGQELPKPYDSRVGYECQISTPKGTLITQQRRLPTVVHLSFAQVASRQAVLLPKMETMLRCLTAKPDIKDASDFLEHLRSIAPNSPSVAGLIEKAVTCQKRRYL